MKRLITLPVTIAMFVSVLACSQQQPEPNAVQPEADTSRARSERATTTPEPTAKPTLPRLDFQSPTLPPAYREGEDPYTQPTPTSPTMDTPTQFSSQPAHVGSADPVAQLVPQNPEFDQSTPLRSIYEQLDMGQFAINPADPINIFTDPNCDYGIRLSNATIKQYNIRIFGYDAVLHANLAVCDPAPVDLYNDNLNNGVHIVSPPPYYEHHSPPYLYDHYVVNSSPIDVITQHPYLFAFKNANFIARHFPDAQNLRFSANPRAYLSDHVKGGPGTGYSHPAIGARPAKGLIGAELWLNQPWFTYHYENTEKVKTDQTLAPVLIYPSGSLKGVLSDTIVDLLQQAVEAANTGYAFAQYTPGRKPRSATLKQAVAAPNLLYNQHHFVQWEFLSPYLPIIRVTTYAEQHLPFTIETEYDIPRYPIQPRSFDQDTFIAPEPAKSLKSTQTTRYAASFVVALQNRWDHFSDPNRLAYFNEGQRAEPLTDLQINRWYATDFMHHSIIGPVVVQVFESEHLKPGIYQKTPAISHWPAPGYISGSAPHAHNAGIRPFSPSTGKEGTALMAYIRSMESEHGGSALAYGPRYPSRTIRSYALGSDPFPGEGVVQLALQPNLLYNRRFNTCYREDWRQEEYCLYLERLSVAYFIKNEETLLTGYDLP